MVVPTQFFGGNSDGGMAMEDWLYEMCPGCRHEDAKESAALGMGGMGCLLPANAYRDPYDDIPEWSPDADPPGPMGLRCMLFEPRPPPTPEETEGWCDGQISLLDGGTS